MLNINRARSIEQYFNEYIRDLKDKAPNNTGALSNSINYSVEEAGNTKIGVEMLSYGKLIDSGVNGTERSVGSMYSFKDKKPPISSLIGYAGSIGANPFALQNSIFKKGIRPKAFIEETTNSNMESFATGYAEAIWEDFYDENNQTK